ncbi:MAG: Fic family protein [bacterium]|nr:Fic family protein [bacterium]
MAWEPIKGLGDGWRELTSPELPPLVNVWSEQRESLQDTESLKDFNERLAREWAIETGILEGLYTLDRGITRLLIEQGIDESLISHDATDGLPGKVAAHIHDQKEAVDWLFKFVKSERPFSESFIKELHALITRSQETATGIDTLGRRVEVPLVRGAYKPWPNDPTRADGSVHVYCPPVQVTVEMERLIDYHDHYLAEEVAPEVLSAWIHHRFTQIHPFQDGNGRVARALASLVFLREGWFPLVVHRDQRAQYIDALEAADDGNLAPLTDMFAAIQRKAFVNALGIAREILRASEHLEQMVAAIGDHFQKRDRALARNMIQAKNHAGALWTQAGQTFATTSAQLSEALQGPQERKVFDDSSSPDETGYRRRWHRAQIIRAAKDLGYYANIREFSAWRRLVLETENGRSEVVLSFHGIGPEYRGIVGVSLSFYRKPETDEGHSMIEDHHTVSKELFQINYLESLDAARARFDTWLDKYLLQALDLWRRGE